MFRKSNRTSITKKRRSKLRTVAEWLFGFCSFLYFLFYWENNIIDVTRFERFDKHIPKTLDGLTIAHVSDLHCKRFGRGNRRLFAKIRNEKPDIIVVTGDLIDERDVSYDYARETIAGLVEIAPVFYVTGNHEAAFIDWIRDSVLDTIEKSGAVMLDNAQVELTREDNGELIAKRFERDPNREPTPDSILLAGISDIMAVYSWTEPLQGQFRYNSVIVKELLTDVPKKDGQFCVLLTHRPEFIRKYAACKIDLVFAGHAHGGQFRLPCLLPNGLYAPDQSYFPKYTCGRYQLDDTTEIVSRGLGPSVIPTRLFNRPNLVVCKLRTDEQTSE